MYCGYNINIEHFENEELYQIGLEQHHNAQKEINSTLSQFTDSKGILSADKLTAKWFPLVSANIFLSHSHKDKKLAITLSGWLMKHFKLVTFIDSCVWGYADKLLKAIDKKYCYNKEKGTYAYSLRNHSTSHVHMMLTTALVRMIDNTECVFFLNTPQSITPDTAIDKTCSPWLYSEISMTRLIRIKQPSDHRYTLARRVAKTMTESRDLKVEYDVDLSHLMNINSNTLNNWKNRFVGSFHENALDVLYTLDL